MLAFERALRKKVPWLTLINCVRKEQANKTIVEMLHPIRFQFFKIK